MAPRFRWPEPSSRRGDPRLYSSWLARTALEAETKAAIEVTAEDAFVAEWVTKKYGDSLTAHLSALAGRPLTLHVNAPAGPRQR